MTTVIDHPYKPKETQCKAHAAIQADKGFMGAKGSGKTAWLVNEAWILAHEYPGNKGIIGRLDLGDLKETTMQFFFDYCPKQLILDHNRSEHWVLIRTKDPAKPSRIKFAHCKDPDSFESGEVGFFALDEANEIPYETVKTLISRRRLKNVRHFGLYAFNPTPTTHWLHDFFVKEPQKEAELSAERILFSNNTFENIDNLPPGYISMLKRIYKGDELRRFLYGEWGSSSSEFSVYPTFRESMYVSVDRIEAIPGLPIIRAMDFGMSAGALWMQCHGRKMNVLKELIVFNRGADQFIPMVYQHSQEYEGYKFIDLSDPTFINNRVQTDARTVKQIAKAMGMTLKDGAIDWLQRTGAVQWFMDQMEDAQACLQIDATCKTLLAGFNGEYRYDEKSMTRGASDVVDSPHTAVHDCLQHGAWYARHKLLRSSPDDMVPLPPETYDFQSYIDQR